MSPTESAAPVCVGDIVAIMEQIAPLSLSEAWDNTGLLLGDLAAPVERLMTCLTLTGDSVKEAIERGAQLVISHHPLPFKPLSKITTASQTGGLIWQLARHGISVYSPHTAWDSAPDGINAQLARKLSLTEIEPLVAAPEGELGAGRCGRLHKTMDLEKIVAKLTQAIPHCRPRAVTTQRAINKVAFGCGSGGSFVAAAAAKGCDLLITGEATFHNCLEAQHLDIGLLMIGHFASEKFAMNHLASHLAVAFPQVNVWGSQSERDPVSTIVDRQSPADTCSDQT